MQNEEGFETRNLGRWVQLTVDEAKSLASDSGVEVDGAKKALLKAETAKLKGMGEEPAKCIDPSCRDPG